MSFAWKKHMCTSLAAAGPNCSTSIISFNCLVSDAPEKRSTKVSRYLFKNWKKKIIPGGSWASPIDFSIAVNFQASFQCSTNAQTSISRWDVGSLQQWRCDCPLLCAHSLYFSTTAANRSYCYAQPFLESVSSQLKSLFPLSSVKEEQPFPLPPWLKSLMIWKALSVSGLKHRVITRSVFCVPPGLQQCRR